MKKLMTMLTAFLLVFTNLFSAVGTVVHAVEPTETTVVVHKILMSKEDLANFNYQENAEKYSGNKIDDLQGYFGNTSAQEIAGVAFNVYKKVEAGTAGAKTGADLATLTATPVGGSGFEATSNYVQVGGDYITEAAGVDIKLEKGTYVFVENKEKSPYYSTSGAELTSAKAVPFTLTLPQAKFDGVGYYNNNDKLHVYPKNTEEKPVVEKTFGDKTTATKNYNIGDDIPYLVTTTIPKDADYKTLSWDDIMVNGLDFKTGSLTIALNGVNFDKVDYKLEESRRGFVLQLTETGLAKVKAAAAGTEGTSITLNYLGVLNASAKVDTEIPNSVEFRYGNRPNEHSAPKEVTPSNGEIEVSKTWGGGTTPVTVKFDVYEAITGTKVTTLELAAGVASVKATGLDNSKTYLIREQSTNLTLPEYGAVEAGKLSVENKKNPNPNPIKPVDPKVITYGRRFVKVDEKDATLAGATFVVLNDQNQFLADKSTAQREAEKAAYQAAETAYQAAVKAQKPAEEIQSLQTARDLAYGIMNNQWNWVADQAQAYVFTAGEAGRFEVKGLVAGNYKLRETKAPEGFALLTSDVAFEVGPNTWNDETGIDGHTKVVNKKIIIPQTGGIGTLFFTIGGLSLMLVAFLAMKKREAQENA